MLEYVVCVGCEVGLAVCSMAVTFMSGVGVCSPVAEVKALSVGLDPVLFLFSAYSVPEEGSAEASEAMCSHTTDLLPG